MEKYGRYGVCSRLRGHLGDVEKKMEAATAGGAEKTGSKRLKQLGQPLTKGINLHLY